MLDAFDCEGISIGEMQSERERECSFLGVCKLAFDIIDSRRRV